ncbi:MAG: HEAT repeat domain-containing protein [Planctomycetota bacterium]|jgi:hypothetical protein
MQLIFCASCRRVVDPADLDGGRGARLGEKTYCADCVPGGPGRPRDVGACRDCQVTVIHAVRTGGGELDHAEHAICRRCTKNPVRSPLSPHQVACAGCDRNVALQDLRIGVALPIDGRAWCRDCRTTTGDGVPAAAPTPITRQVQLPPMPAPAAAEPDRAEAAEPEPPAPPDEVRAAPARRRAKSGALHCDGCRREIGAEELRAGHAQAVDGKLLCGRCRGRSARRAAQKRQRWQIVASLAFLLVIFPLATAGLAIFIYREVTTTDRARRSAAEQPDAPEQVAVQPPAPAPAVPRGSEADQALAEFLAAVRRAAKEGAAQGTPATPAQPGPAAPVAPPPFQPNDPPKKGPAAEVSARSASERAKVQMARLDDPDAGVRLDAVLELAALPPDEAAPGLLRALEDPDPFLRAAAATAAGKVGHESLMQPLLNKLGDPEQRVRRAVARALSRIVKSESFHLFEDLSEEQLQSLRRAIERRRAAAQAGTRKG